MDRKINLSNFERKSAEEKEDDYYVWQPWRRGTGDTEETDGSAEGPLDSLRGNEEEGGKLDSGQDLAGGQAVSGGVEEEWVRRTAKVLETCEGLSETRTTPGATMPP